MNFDKLGTSKKKAIADEVYEWYEKKYQIEIPLQEKQEFWHSACYDPSGLELFERFYNAYVEAKSIDEETNLLKKKVQMSQDELDKLKSEADELTTLELEVDECETTFGSVRGSDSIDIDSQRNNLMKIVKQSAIDQNDDFVKEAENTCTSIGTLTEHLTTDVDQMRLDIIEKKPFQLEDFTQNDELENALQIIKKCSDSLKSADYNRKMLKHRIMSLKSFITSMRESRTKIKGAVAYYACKPDQLQKQVNKSQHEVQILREHQKMKLENLTEELKKIPNTDLTDTILNLFISQLENEISLLVNFSNELDYFKKLQDLVTNVLEKFVDIMRDPHILNSFQSCLIRDMAELTEKLNSTIKKELRRRSDIQNLRGFVDDNDQIGHMLAKHYDLESDQSSIVPVVQKKTICSSLQDDISSKAESKSKYLREQTNMLDANISNIDKNLSELPVTTDRLEKIVKFESDRKVIDTTMKSRMTSRVTSYSTTLANDQTDVSFLEKSRFEMDEFCHQIEMLLEKWDKEKSNQGLNLYLASQQFSLDIESDIESLD